MSKSREQAKQALALLQGGSVTTDQLKQLNEKYPSDPIYYLRTILKVEVSKRKENGKTVYFLPTVKNITNEVQTKLPELDPDPILCDVHQDIAITQRRYVIPEWEGSVFQKWAKNFCAKNQWRVAHVLGDYDDCLAECAKHFVICCQRYGATVNSAQHFMYMYKQWVIPEFHTLATRDGSIRKLYEAMQPLPGDEVDETPESQVNLLLELDGASEELKSVLKIMFNAPQEMLEVLRQEASSVHPKQFFKSAMKTAGVKVTKAGSLIRELQKLLT